MLVTYNYTCKFIENYRLGSIFKFGRLICEKFFIYIFVGPEIATLKYNFDYSDTMPNELKLRKTSRTINISYGIGTTFNLTENIALSIEIKDTKSKNSNTNIFDYDITSGVKQYFSNRNNSSTISLKINYVF